MRRYAPLTACILVALWLLHVAIDGLHQAHAEIGPAVNQTCVAIKGLESLISLPLSFCVGQPEDATPTPTRTPGATNTPIATSTATATAMPTGTATSTATPKPVAMIEGVAICTDHAPTLWHALVKRDSSGAIQCTYGHEHHDNPNGVNAIFGQPGAWWGNAGQEISYPWQTVSALGQENVAKHEGYKWHARQGMPCVNANQTTFYGCIRGYRVLVHSLGTAADSTARFHSFGAEIQVEYFGTVGIARGGGHMDTGHLALEFGGNPTKTDCPNNLAGDAPFTECIGSPKRHHAGANHPSLPDYPSGARNWYVSHQLFQTGPKIEPFAPDDWANPANQLPQSSPTTNNSAGLLENLAFSGSGATVQPYGARGTVVHIRTHTDKAGAEAGACSPLGASCIPFHFDGVSAQYQVQAGQWGDQVREYDVPSPVTGKSLIRFPN